MAMIAPVLGSHIHIHINISQCQIRRPVPVVGVLGCMAERLKHELLDVKRLADMVVGPDAYRDLPRLVDIVQVVYARISM